MKQYLIAIKLTVAVALLVLVYGIFKEVQYGSVRRLERLMNIELPDYEANIVSKEEVRYNATDVINHIYLAEPLSTDTKATIESRCIDSQNEAWELFGGTYSYGREWNYLFRCPDKNLVCYIGETHILATYIVQDIELAMLLVFIVAPWLATLLVWGAILAICKFKNRHNEI